MKIFKKNTTIPIHRNYKFGWHSTHRDNVYSLKQSHSSMFLLGDSIIKGLSRYIKVWKNLFNQYEAINGGIGGDKTQNVL